MSESSSVERTLGLAAAWLMLVALLTGIYAAAAMTGKLHVDGHTALASHLNALMGTFLLGVVGWTMPMLSYGPRGKRVLATVLIVSSFANWFITAVKAALFVAGIDVQGQPKNDGIFVALQIFVVVPMIAAAVAWIIGFRKRAA
jgi:hydroxylaminobenzene mutase